MNFIYLQKRVLVFFITLLCAHFIPLEKGEAYTSPLYEGCIEGNGIEKTINMKHFPFNILEVSGPIRVKAHSNQIEKYIRITGDENILSQIKTSPRGNHLIIYPEKPVCPAVGITIELAVADLVALIAKSSAKIEIDEIYTNRFSLVASGGGDIEISGAAIILDAEITGGGDMEFEPLKTRHAIISSTGNGIITVHATEKLQVDIMGGADIFYYGSPLEVIKTIEGSGSLSISE